MEIKSGIYCIENIENGKRYVGKGFDVEYRMYRDHRESPAIYNAIKKYGSDNFIRYPIQYCKEDEMNFWENYYIINLHTHVSEGMGYNITWGGEGTRGLKHSNETIEKMRVVHTGVYPNDETKRKMSKNHSNYKGKNNPNFGTHQSKETIAKRLASMDGYKCSDETKEKISKTNLGKKHKNSSSKYFGVCRFIPKIGNPFWIGTVRDNRKNVRLGNFKTEIEAALAYDKYVIEHDLLNPLNFPEDYINRKAGD